MAKTRLDDKLLEKLSKKTQKTIKYLREQISKRASKRGVSSEAYFVYWLINEGIPAAVYQRKLSDAIKDEIRGLLKKKDVGITRSFTTKKQKVQLAEKVFQIEKLKIKSKPSLIKQNLLNNAQNSAELYPALFIFENSVRNFIQQVLERKYGKSWWKTKVNNEIQNKVKQRMQNERMNPWHGSRGAHEIHYTDFVELAKIIKNNAGDFNSFFAGMQGRIGWLTQRLEELSVSRNNIAHVSPLKARDRSRLLLYFQDWYEQIDILNQRLK